VVKITEDEKKKLAEFDNRNKVGQITFYIKSGNVVYIDYYAKRYHCTLSPNTKAYLLFSYLVKNPQEYFNYDTLVKEIGENKSNTYETDERTVRDIVQAIRNKLKGDKKKCKDFIDPFKVVPKQIMLNCTATIEK